MPNIIAVRTADTGHAHGKESDAIKSYCERLSLPHKGLEWRTNIAEAMDRGAIIIGRRFADLFKTPSEVIPTITEALSRGKQIHCTDLGELTAQLTMLRVLCAAWAPLEDQIASLNKRIEHEEAAHHIAVREAAAHAVRKVIDMQLVSVLEDVAQAATDRAMAAQFPQTEHERWGTDDDVADIITRIGAKQKAA